MNMDMYYSKPIVMDNGTALSKIGFAGEDEPRFIIPTLPTSPIRGSLFINTLNPNDSFFLIFIGFFLQGLLKRNALYYVGIF